MLAISITIFSVGCGSPKPEIFESEFLQQHLSLKEFYTSLESAKKDKVDFYAPNGFLRANKLYVESFKLAKNSEEEKSNLLVQEGEAILTKSVDNADDAKELLKEVTKIRDETIILIADKKYKSRLNDADEEFMKVNSYIEKGELEDLLEYSNKLISLYNGIRSDILKNTLLSMVNESSSLAKTNKAKDLAPKTIAKAELELKTALDIIIQDPSKISEAKTHAKLSIHNYKKANQISKMIKHFKEEKYTPEDYILWYWEQLETINEHLGDELDFTKNNYLVTDNINRATAALIKELQEARESLKKQHELSSAELLAQQKRYDALYKRFSGQLTELKVKKEKQKMKYKTKEEQYTFVNSLFDSKDEARIYKEGDNIVISAFGIDFERNRYKIPKSEYIVLTKIISAIKQYPNASIGVYGHTDSIGEAQANMKLSIQRANNVTNFLVEIGKINRNRITTKGFGESKPVATNMIKAGRRQNSRIEIHIIPSK